jgi:hypothetical protein
MAENYRTTHYGPWVERYRKLVEHNGEPLAVWVGARGVLEP